MQEDEVTYRIRHATSYVYDDLVTLAHNEARLTPRNGPWQVAHSARLVVEPTPAFMARERDYFGNWLTLFALQEPHRHFLVTAYAEVTVRAPFLPDPEDTPPWEEVRDLLASSHDPDVFEAVEHVYESPHVQLLPELRDYALQSFTPGRPILAASLELCHRINNDFAYKPGSTNVATPVATVFSEKRGVCQDFAHLMIGCVRSLGLSARYVSGYLRTRSPAGQPRRVGADASHAWVSVFCPGYDFVDLDPTNDMLVTTEHPTLAWGRDYGDVSPLRGVLLGGGSHRVEVAVDVEPLDDGESEDE
ncbi:MAG TPA: transglutaminase family protein [Polyangiales bacterium]|nr:transglutaminase family protein [Polyangiales bacterium]